MSDISARKALRKKLEAMGYPGELGDLLANELRTEKSMMRMVGYLNAVKKASLEDIADEMLAIVQDAEQWRRKKMMESNQAKYNMMLQNGLNQDE